MQKGSYLSLVAGVSFGAIIAVNGLMFSLKGLVQPVLFNLGMSRHCFMEYVLLQIVRVKGARPTCTAQSSLSWICFVQVARFSNPVSVI